jgi:hypothetical protein
MPFDKDFDYIYGTIKKELTDCGIMCQRVDEITGSIPIINKILKEIIQSQYIIVDLTGLNPNVFYELGIAHTFKDARNILLIKQKGQVPFDITHLTYIEYDPDNLKLLTPRINEFINDNQYVSDFYDALNLCGIINVIDQNNNQYIEIIQNQLGQNLTSAIKLLNGQISEVAEHEVETLLNAYNQIINQSLQDRNLEIIPGVLRIYYELLSSASQYAISDNYIQSFLNMDYSPYGIHESELLAWKTDFAVIMALRNKKMYLTLSWIIRYFERSKSATIDLNRHKLEGFLFASTSKDVNDAMTHALHHKTCYIREHMADIIGEKRLTQSLPDLQAQLKIEDNFFTAASIISAIGKLQDTKGIESINQWIESNYEEIYSTKQFFVLRRALMAITALDDTPDEVHRKEFESCHSKVLKDYFII